MKSIASRIFICMLLVSASALAAKPRAERRWNQVGKRAHVQVARKPMKQRTAACTKACHKAGAHKATDLGACREACVFG